MVFRSHNHVSIPGSNFCNAPSGSNFANLQVTSADILNDNDEDLTQMRYFDSLVCSNRLVAEPHQEQRRPMAHRPRLGWL